MRDGPEAPVEVVDTSEGFPSAFLMEATQFPCSRCKGLSYSLSNEHSYFLHCKNSQEVPVRINIVFYTSKEELMTGGHRQEAKPNFLGSLAYWPPLSHLHFLGRRGGR